jgi:NIPSNAP
MCWRTHTGSGDGTADAPERVLTMYSPVVELRQYTLHARQRDVLIHLFEQEFIEPQESAGMAVIGQFRDLDNPDRYVWLRGFPDMQSRHEALAAFYYGPVWRRHHDAANATMVDSDNVLLLRPAYPTSGFYLDPKVRPPRDAQEQPSGLVVATILSWDTAPDADFLHLFEHGLAPILTEKGASILSSFVTDPHENTFRALPVREGEQVFVWFARFHDQTAYEAHHAALEQSPEWREQWVLVAGQLKTPPQILRLAPTARSLLR